jgi:hypothetical protein
MYVVYLYNVCTFVCMIINNGNAYVCAIRLARPFFFYYEQCHTILYVCAISRMNGNARHCRIHTVVLHGHYVGMDITYVTSLYGNVPTNIRMYVRLNITYVDCGEVVMCTCMRYIRLSRLCMQ